LFEKGLLFTEDKLVPIQLVNSANNDHVIPRGTEGDLTSLQEFEETYFVQALAGDEGSNHFDQEMNPLYWYPPLGLPLSRLVLENLTPYVVYHKQHDPDDIHCH
jgi:hypothetical protein